MKATHEANPRIGYISPFPATIVGTRPTRWWESNEIYKTGMILKYPFGFVRNSPTPWSEILCAKAEDVRDNLQINSKDRSVLWWAPKKMKKLEAGKHGQGKLRGMSGLYKMCTKRAREENAGIRRGSVSWVFYTGNPCWGGGMGAM